MATQDILKNKLIIFGGKGGVGKTTCATATAFALLPKRTLLVSADPAHCLGRCLGQEIGGDIAEVGAAQNLYALEISAEKTFQQFKQDYWHDMVRLMETSAGIEFLTKREREELLSLPIPGLDEVMGLKRLIDLIEEGAFDKYVLDTAPAGHALRLISMPDVFDKWIGIFYRLRRKHRDREKAYRKRDRADEFLVAMKKSVTMVKELLRSDAAEFVVVATPERVVIAETKDLICRLTSWGVRVKHLIVNRFFPEVDSAFSKEYRDEQERRLEDIRSAFSNLEIKVVPLLPSEPTGGEGLIRFAELMYGSGKTQATQS